MSEARRAARQAEVERNDRALLAAARTPEAERRFGAAEDGPG